MASCAAGAGVPLTRGDVPPPAVALSEAALSWDRTSASDVALIVDDYSLAFFAQGNALSKPLLVSQQAELATIGAPVDVWLLDDLIAGRVPDYRLYVVVNAFLLDAKAREVVRNHVSRNGKVVLWVYAPGALDETASGQTAFELTGVSVGFVPKIGRLRVKVTDASHPLLDGTPKGLEYGPEEPAGPVFFAMPAKGCEYLGFINVPSLAANPPQAFGGLVVRPFDGWTSVYSAAPDVPAVILRGLARKAGVHLYLDTGDVVWGNASMLAVHALTAGDKHVRLRAPAEVHDAVSGEMVAPGAEEFRVTMQAGETRIFYIGDPARFAGEAAQ